MSRRNRHRESARRAKFWDPDAAGGLREPEPPTLAAAGETDLEDRILAVLPPWQGDPHDGGATTGEVASQLFIRPRSPEREILNDALTSLRKAGLAKYEYDRMFDAQARWWRRP